MRRGNSVPKTLLALLQPLHDACSQALKLSVHPNWMERISVVLVVIAFKTLKEVSSSMCADLSLLGKNNAPGDLAESNLHRTSSVASF